MKSNGPIEVETEATVFERSVHRKVMVRVEPSGLVSFRLKNTLRTYELKADALYHMAVKAAVSANGKGKR